MHRLAWLVALVFLAAACQNTINVLPTPTVVEPTRTLALPTAVPLTVTTVPTVRPTSAPTLTPTGPPTATPRPTGTPPPTAPPPTATLLPTRTPDEFSAYDVEGLRSRQYGEGSIETVRVLETRPEFTRYLIQYPSDGLKITGVMNVPTREGPFPIVIINHGYVAPRSYRTTTAYTLVLADQLARNGYLTLHPDYRNYGGSDQGPNPFGTGYAIDVLNLVQLAKKLPNVRADAIGMLGHSMGGPITVRTLVITSDVKAAVLYAGMSTDDAEDYSFRRSQGWFGGTAHSDNDWSVSPTERPDVYARIAPITYLTFVTAAVSLHHGDVDTEVPIRFSERLTHELQAASKSVEYFTYPGQAHWFTGQSNTLFLQRVVAFFDQRLKS